MGGRGSQVTPLGQLSVELARHEAAAQEQVGRGRAVGLLRGGRQLQTLALGGDLLLELDESQEGGPGLRPTTGSELLLVLGGELVQPAGHGHQRH